MANSIVNINNFLFTKLFVLYEKLCHLFLFDSEYNGKISGQRANDLQYFMVTPECSGWECGRLNIHIILTNIGLSCPIESNPRFLLSCDKKAAHSRSKAQVQGQETISSEGDATRAHRDYCLRLLLVSLLGELSSFHSFHNVSRMSLLFPHMFRFLKSLLLIPHHMFAKANSKLPYSCS